MRVTCSFAFVRLKPHAHMQNALPRVSGYQTPNSFGGLTAMLNIMPQSMNPIASLPMLQYGTSTKEKPMALTIEEVTKVAHLARLELAQAELETMQHQLSGILDYIGMLSEVDVADVPPTAQVTDLHNVLREDVVRPSLPREEALANAPQQQDGMFRVKAIFDENPT